MRMINTGMSAQRPQFFSPPSSRHTLPRLKDMNKCTIGSISQEGNPIHRARSVNLGLIT
jgi:hypothetical protein